MGEDLHLAPTTMCFPLSVPLAGCLPSLHLASEGRGATVAARGVSRLLQLARGGLIIKL